MQLRIPGPIPVPDEVLQSMTKQMINHRGKEFGELIQKLTDQAQKVISDQGGCPYPHRLRHGRNGICYSQYPFSGR